LINEEWKRYNETTSPNGSNPPSKGSPAVETEESRRAYRRYERIANWLYTLPWVRPHLKSFVIDIKYGDERGFSPLLPEEKRQSCESEISEETIDLLAKDPKQFTAMTGGAIFAEIDKFMSMHGFIATERGSGGCGGHLGYICTEEERDKLLLLLHSRFGAAIRSGAIATTVAWFKVYPPKRN
jgi:hypothetical protein